MCRSPDRACKKSRSEQQHSPCRARSHSLSFAVAVFPSCCLPSSACAWCYFLSDTQDLTSLQHLPQAATTARFSPTWFAWLSALLQGGGKQIPNLRTAKKHVWWVLERPQTLLSWMSEGWKNLLWRWLASRYLLWNILSVLGFYNDSKYVVRCPRHDINVFCPHPPLEYLSALKSFIELSALGQTWCIQGTHVFCWLSAEAGAYHLSRVNLLSAKLHCANYFQRWKQTFCNDLVRTVNIDICYLPVSAEKS